jgi:hypothetical protein
MRFRWKGIGDNLRQSWRSNDYPEHRGKRKNHPCGRMGVVDSYLSLFSNPMPLRPVPNRRK